MKKEKSERAYFRALGRHIAVRRKMCGITLETLAKTLGVSLERMTSMETGDEPVSVPMLAKLSLTFSVPVEEMMGLSKPLSRSKRIAWHAQRVQTLKEKQQDFVYKVVDLILSADERLPPPVILVQPNEIRPVAKAASRRRATAVRRKRRPHGIAPRRAA